MSNPDLQTFNPHGHAPFAPTYSHISVAPLQSTTKLVSLAGQIGHDSVTGETPPTLAAQIALALENLDKCLAAAGANKKDIIHVRQYVVNMGALSENDQRLRAELYSKYMDGHKPPSTLVGVESLATAELLYEIEAMAVIHA